MEACYSLFTLVAFCFALDIVHSDKIIKTGAYIHTYSKASVRWNSGGWSRNTDVECYSNFHSDESIHVRKSGIKQTLIAKAPSSPASHHPPPTSSTSRSATACPPIPRTRTPASTPRGSSPVPRVSSRTRSHHTLPSGPPSTPCRRAAAAAKSSTIPWPRSSTRPGRRRRESSCANAAGLRRRDYLLFPLNVCHCNPVRRPPWRWSPFWRTFRRRGGA